MMDDTAGPPLSDRHPSTSSASSVRRWVKAVGKEGPSRHLSQQTGNADARQHSGEALGQGLGLRLHGYSNGM